MKILLRIFKYILIIILTLFILLAMLAILFPTSDSNYIPENKTIQKSLFENVTQTSTSNIVSVPALTSIVTTPTVKLTVTPIITSTPIGGVIGITSTTKQQNLSCNIKGNVNYNGDKIYHLPLCPSYNITKIKPTEGDRWFCTEDEAKSSGFRLAKNC